MSTKTAKPAPAPLTREQLKAWREQRQMTQAEAEAWWLGSTASGGRTWRRWEAGDSPIPNPLARTVQALIDRATTRRTVRG